jgi:acetoin utilization protein AcuC
VTVFLNDQTAAYGFSGGHPFGTDRQAAFWSEAERRGMPGRLARGEPRCAARAELKTFHSAQYLDFVAARSKQGISFLDSGDTPAEPGIYEHAAWVVGATLAAASEIAKGRLRRAFVPIGGLHHAGRDHAAGFCVFNDIGVAIEMLRREFQIRRIAYIDIDAHHGDGVFYAFEADPDLIIADAHEDGRTLYPGTGRAEETGRGAAAGTKLNVAMPAGAGDEAFLAAWPRIEEFVRKHRPEFVLFQCGTDSLAGDPITHLQYSPAAHAHAATRLAALAEDCCAGRLLAMGGGGYNRDNLARGWCAVIEALLDAPLRDDSTSPHPSPQSG